jgi:hypothetical protein
VSSSVHTICAAVANCGHVHSVYVRVVCRAALALRLWVPPCVDDAAVHANSDLNAGVTERCSGTALPVVHGIVVDASADKQCSCMTVLYMQSLHTATGAWQTASLLCA